MNPITSLSETQLLIYAEIGDFLDRYSPLLLHSNQHQELARSVADGLTHWDFDPYKKGYHAAIRLRYGRYARQSRRRPLAGSTRSSR